MKRFGIGAGVIALALLVVVLSWHSGPETPAQRPPLGLFTSLPIWWSEAPNIAAQIAAPEKPHWARAVLEARHRVVLLDTLLQPTGIRDLIVAQPRPLAAEENVALDSWVRGGGHLLLFADPLLTWESRFALGDRRRPQGTVLLGPILAHWGLALRFDAEQQLDQLEELREIAGTGLPVRLGGEFAGLPGGSGDCRIMQAGLIAECRIGKGRALIVADSAVLEPSEQAAGRVRRLRALRALMQRAFSR